MVDHVCMKKCHLLLKYIYISIKCYFFSKAFHKQPSEPDKKQQPRHKWLIGIY